MDAASRSTNASIVLTVNPQPNPGGGNTFLGLPALEGYGILVAIAIVVTGVVAFRSARKQRRQPPAPPPPQQ